MHRRLIAELAAKLHLGNEDRVQTVHVDGQDLQVDLALLLLRAAVTGVDKIKSIHCEIYRRDN